MKKLRLDLDVLAVETFEPQTVEKPEGTVRGQDASFNSCRSFCTWECCCTAETFDGTC
jgi:hypothetical protein